MQGKVLILRWPAPRKGSLEALIRSLPMAGYSIEVMERHGDWQAQVQAKVREWRPDYFITFQRLYPQNKGVADCLREHGVRTLFLDFGIGAGHQHYASVIFDPCGENATSQIANGGFERLLANPAQVEAMNARLPDVDRMAAELNRISQYAAPPEELPDDFVFIPLQRTGDQVLRYDSLYPDTAEYASDLCTHFKVAGAFGVFKPHPLDTKFKWNWRTRGEDYLMMDRVGRSAANDALNVWLMQHSRRTVVVNSTMLFSAMLLDRPITQLGRGWCDGNAVLDEVYDPADAFADYPPADSERRRRFLAMMLSRERSEADLANPTVAAEVIRYFHDVADWAPVGATSTTTTTVPLHAPDPKTTTVAAPARTPVVEQNVVKDTTRTIPPQPYGIAVVAMGEKYFTEFRKLLSSIRRFHKDTPVAVVTNQDTHSVRHVVDDNTTIVPVDMPSADNRIVKTRLPEYVPQEWLKCVYLDADTVLEKPIGELWRYLDFFDMCYAYDTLRPTVGARASKPTPLVNAGRMRELAQFCGPNATMPQAGFLAWRRNDRVSTFYEMWHKHWRDLGEGDMDAFAYALWKSDVRCHTLIAPVWQNSPGRGAIIGHNWGCHCRKAKRTPKAYKDEHLENKPPVITTIYIPDVTNERYPDTEGLVRHCITETFRRYRFVGIDKAPGAFEGWLESLGHKIVRLNVGRPCRMNLLLGQCVRHVTFDTVWTIEQDAIVSPDVAAKTEDLLGRLPDDIAAVFLRAVDEQGRRVHPLNNERSNSFLGIMKEEPHLQIVSHAPFNATLWRTKAIQSVDFTKTPKHGKCDVKTGDQLRAKGWRFVVSPPELTALHYPHSSFKRRAMIGKE